MKKLLNAAMVAVLFFTCSEDILQDEKSVDPNFRVFEYSGKGGDSFSGNKIIEGEVPCYEQDLIAGQYYVAGSVKVSRTETDIMITYDTSHTDWSISATHMSIGDCDLTIPTTGSGNPKVGRFDHSSDHSVDVNEVVYAISLDVISEIALGELYYCFAAHAVVVGPDGEETAWAQGLDFDGNSWAMYVQAALEDCSMNIDAEIE